MPWNGSGQFTRNFSWVNDAANSIPITASRVDSDSNDMTGNGFGNTLTRDGQGSATANLPMNGFKHTNCAVGVAPTDYATVAQVTPLAPIASPSFTGTPLAPTAAPGTSTTQIATTAFVSVALGSYLPLSGGTLVGPLVTNLGALPNVNGATKVPQTYQVTDANTDVLLNRVTRNGTSGTFSTVSWIIERVVDSTHLSFIQFGETTGGGGLAFGSNLTQFATMSNVGVWNFFGPTSVNNTFNVPSTNSFIYGGVTQPHVFVQSATPTAVAVGDLWFF